MDKILIKTAIKNGNVYEIDNQYEIEDKDDIRCVIKGRIKLLNFEEFRLNKKDIQDTITMDFLENKIAKLELEYINLNFIETEFITHNFYLSDLDGFEFVEIQDPYVTKAVAKHLNKTYWDIAEYRNKTYIPKIKTKIEFYYILPDEETDYFLKVNHCKIKEL